jgi:DNA-binding NarL/FixJ family response regulator
MPIVVSDYRMDLCRVFSGNMKILLADEYVLFRDAMRYVLRMLNEKVDILEAGNFHEALKVAKGHSDINIALLDLDLLGRDLTESVKLLHTIRPNIVVVVSSYTNQSEDIKKVIGSGANGYFYNIAPISEMVRILRLALNGGANICV